MQLFEAQFERLKKASGVETDTAFASFLGLRQGSISGAKRKNNFRTHGFFRLQKRQAFHRTGFFGGAVQCNFLASQSLRMK